ncbi:hypothetical protein JYU34_007019 [Plutella xylostella]|uniref:Tetraspanin n=2 Tax=Plutella xylostella TaxID=51655 RepID=A0A8S4DGN6_PLUXY|nr:hypothetical protein JYU34_007019 [Plutella xylostella]CAG9095970.1 unnamed protein product [Plutella xylostella]
MFSKIFTTVKYTLVSVCFLFVITGIIILAVGSSVQSAYNAYHPFLSERFFSLPAFCIATGIIIFIIASLGFYGAYKENYYLSMTFAGLMIVMLIFQLSACIAGYVLRGNTIAIVEKQLLSTTTLYGKGPDKSFEITALWDEVQRDFSCCGVNNASDWYGKLDPDGIPVSCCTLGVGAISTFNCTAVEAYKTGCGPAFGSWVSAHAGSIGAAGVFLVILQALAVAGSMWLAKISRSENLYP